MDRLGGIQKALTCRENPFLNRLEEALSAEYRQILRQEEIFWYQKSRCQWLSFGDRNITYFHTKTIIRRQRNKIKALKNEQNIWVWEEGSLKMMVTDFYQNLFRGDHEQLSDARRMGSHFPIIDSSHIDHLIFSVLDEEVKAAIFGMKSYKALGPDGYRPIFYQC